jgi:tetratricopeptide (TPR) repeat protein
VKRSRSSVRSPALEARQQEIEAMKIGDVGSRLRPAAIALGLYFAATSGASAQDTIPGYPNNVDAFDPREVAMLPGYCAYTQLFRDHVSGGNDQAMKREWESVFGPTFIHMHHYCFGLMKTNRAVLLSRDPTVRLFYLNDAISEYDYVITRAPSDFVLLPEIFTKKAQDLVLLGKGPLAVLEFRRAIETKADYWSAYAYLSDYYIEIRDTKKAIEVLKEGLSHAPNAKALQRRLDDVDPGKRRKP